MGEEKSLMLDIFERLGRIDEKLDGLNQIRLKLDETENIANQALESTKSAHKRLDKIDKVIFWAGTTIIGAVIVALLALVIKTN